MEFSNVYYSRLLLNAPEKAKEYLANCQWKWIISNSSVIQSKESLDTMTEYLKSRGVKVRPNFKLETIQRKYEEEKAKENL
jgi:hypothetical protein